MNLKNAAKFVGLRVLSAQPPNLVPDFAGLDAAETNRLQDEVAMVVLVDCQITKKVEEASQIEESGVAASAVAAKRTRRLFS